MAVKIRLQRKGRKKKPFYHIVVADARAKRDGRLIEKIGSYNPLTAPATIHIDRDRAYDWLMKGAQPTNTVKAIMKYNGIYYRKHLMRGVEKGALTEEKAMELYHAWIAEKEAAIKVEVEKTAEKKKAYLRQIDGVAPPRKQKVMAADGDAAKPEAPKTLLESIEKTEIDTKSGEMVAESTAEPVKEEVKEVAPVVEEKKEEPKPVEVVKEAAPVVEEKKEEPAPVVAEVKKEVEVKKVVAEVKKEVEVKKVVAEVKKEVEVRKVVAEVKKVEKVEKADDLKKIEGVGPKIEELLVADGINTWKKLSKANVDTLKAILEKAGSRYTMHNPTTWPQQAQLCVDEKWDELKELQDRLDGGVDKG